MSPLSLSSPVGVVFSHLARRHLYSRRLQVLGGVLLGAMITNGCLASLDLQRQRDKIARVTAAAQEQDSIERVFLPRALEEFAYVDHTGSRQMPSYLVVTPWAIDVPLETDNVLTSDPLDYLDWRSIFGSVLVLLALLMSYDSVAAEVESGRLRLLLAQPISRSVLLMASIGTVVFIVSCLVASALLANLISICLSGALQLSGRLVVRYTVAFLLLELGVFVASLIGFGFSCVFRTSWMALLAALGVWVTFLVLIPVGASSFAGIVRPTPSVYGLEQAIERTRYEFESRARPISSMDITAILKQELNPADAAERIRRFQETQTAQNVLELQKFKAGVSDVRQEFLQRMWQQNVMREQISRVSPFEVVYQGLDATFIAGENFQTVFERAARRYVDVFSPVSRRLQGRYFNRALQLGPTIQESGYSIHSVMWLDYGQVPHDVLRELPRFHFDTPPIDHQKLLISFSLMGMHVLVAILFALVAAGHLSPV